MDFDFEGKRDRWNNYDVTDHHVLVEEYEKMEAEKKRQRLLDINKGKIDGVVAPAESKDDSSDSENEEEKADDERGYAEAVFFSLLCPFGCFFLFYPRITTALSLFGTLKGYRDHIIAVTFFARAIARSPRPHEQTDMPGTKFDAKARYTIRNLRLREDTAKYLHNLDTESAFYDPKTRSLTGDPHAKSGE